MAFFPRADEEFIGLRKAVRAFFKRALAPARSLIKKVDRPAAPSLTSAGTSEVLKGGWTRQVHPCPEVDDAATLRRAGGADGPTYSNNGQGSQSTQAGGADGPTDGNNGAASRDSTTDTVESTEPTMGQLRLALDDMRRAFERNRARPRRSYPRRGAALRQLVLETIDELDEFEWPEDCF